MNKALVKKALYTYFYQTGLNTPKLIIKNIDGAFKYLLQLKLVRPEWYTQYRYAAEQQYAIYRSRK